MRRASTYLAVLGLAVLAFPAAASATKPTVTLKAIAAPIPGFPHTGDILGAGTALKTEFTIKGTEYGGRFPSPLTGVTVSLPKGAKIHSQGFPTCAAALKAAEAEARKEAADFEAIEHCSAKSKAGPVGHADGFVSFGSTRVEEETTVQPYFVPGGGLAFYVEGKSPSLIEIVSSGHYANAGGLFGQKLITAVPLVETVPGALYASVESIKVDVGAAIKQGKKTIYYGTVPTKCPKGGFPLKAELSFLAPTEPVTVSYKLPCPKKK